MCLYIEFLAVFSNEINNVLNNKSSLFYESNQESVANYSLVGSKRGEKLFSG